jgi:hypothetical protein
MLSMLLFVIQFASLDPGAARATKLRARQKNIRPSGPWTFYNDR